MADQDLDAPFRHNREMIANINAANLGWKAAAQPVFELLSRRDAFRNAGQPYSPSHFPDVLIDDRDDADKYAGLPESWDWRNVDGVNYVSPIRNQQHCGSCFTFASLATIEARIRVATKNQAKTIVSPQHALSCNIYAQGCNGGFPYQVAKFGADFELVDEACFPYQSETGKCSDTCSSPSARIRLSKPRFVGGYFGACNEPAMMRELVATGPLTVGFLCGPGVMAYRSGIFTLGPLASDQDLSTQATRLAAEGVHEWEKTSHSVSIVGYGVENGTKFWIVKNSWGPTWGEDGYIRVKRGTNDGHIESAAVAVDIDLAKSQF